MRVYILGIDGYLGWALYQHLLVRGHEVGGCDNFFRRNITDSLIPLVRHADVIDNIDVGWYQRLAERLKEFQPDAVVHMAEMPSAPYSMSSPENSLGVQRNNVVGSLSVLWAMKKACPDAHLLKVGTLGEYIPSSLYHISKIQDTAMCQYTADLWDLRITDVMQGPVFGIGGRFDYNEVWGTVINRWVCMGVVGHPLLVYGQGEQVRGFLPIYDSLNCFEIALEHPPDKGEHRVINQYADKIRIRDIAEMIARMCMVRIEHIQNPRVEKDTYDGDTNNSWLLTHGYEPETDFESSIGNLIEHVRKYRSHINPDFFRPKVRWRNGDDSTP